MGYNAQLSFTGAHDVESKLSIYGGIDYKHDWPIRSLRIQEPLGYGFNFYTMPGFFVDAAATLSVSASGTDHFASAGCYEFSSRRQSVLKPAFSFKHVGTDFNAEMTLDGRFAFGAFLDAGFSYLDERLDHVAYRTEAGLELTGSAVLLKSDIERGKHDTGVYQKLKNSKISWNPFVSTGVTYGLAVWDETYTLTRSVYPPTWQRDLVPTFSNAKLTQNVEQYTSVDASIEARGNCVFPVPVSFVLFDKDEKEVGNYSFSKNYTNTASQFQHTFNNLSIGEYTLYPKVSFFGFDLLASPSSKDALKAPAPEITKLYQVGYSNAGFNVDGQTYKYKFDLMVKAQAETLDGVEDWGFVYKSPTGENIQKSFMKQGSSAEYMFSIFTNQNTTSSSIYTYIIYSDNEIKNGSPYWFKLSYPEEPEDPESPEEPKELEELGHFHLCPDSNHPHAIDLGLPSGTKWACCNVGANAPEAYGGYYAWGETSEKDSYSINNYRHCYFREYWNGYYWLEPDFWACESLGEDIAGNSQYDVAFATMGKDWSMPNVSQFTELDFECTHEWVQINGINGLVFTGKNGSSIFLPATGKKYSPVSSYSALEIEKCGYYWTSTLGKEHLIVNGISADTEAYHLRFNSSELGLQYTYNGNWNYRNYTRATGCAVRAIYFK